MEVHKPRTGENMEATNKVGKKIPLWYLQANEAMSILGM